MENLLESNERTLVIFDSVCSGLSECLALVHADIRQMTEHRNQLALLLEQEKSSETTFEPLETSSEGTTNKPVQTNLDEHHEDDPHHLARLKLLDKRLADSFSQALSLCDQQKSSLVIKKQQYADQQASRAGRPSIFQVLLGKTSSNSSSSSGNNNSNSGKNQQAKQLANNRLQIVQERPADSHRIAIDDINRQTRLAMQYSKQLEAHLLRVEDLRANYEMHLRMGLVSRASSASHYSSLGRRPQHHTSSLIVNDTSSLGTTHSSLSSLNLGSWSFSRRQRFSTSDRSSSSRNNSSASQPPPDSDCLILGRQLQLEPIAARGLLLHRSASQSSLKGPAKSARKSLAADKSSIKEFVENLERIEREFESYMGSFLLNIEDIQGFARVCQGDVFEITIKYGREQKFKTKISVLKDSRQKCEQRQTVFKARISDVIAIKAYECKGLGKRLLLGHKLCETRDLFTARSQLMTISLNQTGSIKLNLIITWNPLHLAPQSSLSLQPGVEISHISLPQAQQLAVGNKSLTCVPSYESLAHAYKTQHRRR